YVQSPHTYKLEIFDLSGRSKFYGDNISRSGIIWNAQNENSGIYFYRITCGKMISSGKLLLVK
ncbi:hypothetical protein DRQ33_03800, partial [bacterium]